MPKCPHSAALIPVSPTETPLNRRSCQSRAETVWERTPSGVPALACMPISTAASQPAASAPVYSVHSFCTTHSQRGSSSSGSSELNDRSPPAPWQSMTTTSSAPALNAPRTAALISAV